MSFMNYGLAESKSPSSGSVLCWASNAVGEQAEPCVFHVVSLGAPSPPKECSVSSRGTGSVGVSCSSNASPDQTLVLEVFHEKNGSQELDTRVFHFKTLDSLWIMNCRWL